MDGPLLLCPACGQMRYFFFDIAKWRCVKQKKPLQALLQALAAASMTGLRHKARHKRQEQSAIVSGSLRLAQSRPSGLAELLKFQGFSLIIAMG